MDIVFQTEVDPGNVPKARTPIKAPTPNPLKVQAHRYKINEKYYSMYNEKQFLYKMEVKC